MFQVRGISFVCLLAVLSAPASLYARNDAGDHQPPTRYARKIEIHGISNAGKVSAFLYRGSQPKPQAIDELKELGIDTIVDLRGERHGLMVRERKHAQSLGMRFVNIPGSGWSAPTDAQLVQFFTLMGEKPRRHVFVHCWLGGDRAGVFLAAYRIAFDGWTPEQALHEMHMFHFHGFWHPVMTAYIQAFPDHLATSSALAPFRSKAAALNTHAAESSAAESSVR